MEPTNRTDGFTPRYRHFPPLSTVWVQNPFDHDVVFQVADELNRPFRYKLPAHKPSELPGGAVATLGVKAIVDELIQENNQILSQWDLNVRSAHEEKIILRYKEAPNREKATVAGGEVDLGVKSKEVPPEDDDVEPTNDKAFPGLEGFPDAEAADEPPTPHEAIANEGVKSMVSSTVAHLPTDAVLEDAGE